MEGARYNIKTFCCVCQITPEKICTWLIINRGVNRFYLTDLNRLIMLFLLIYLALSAKPVPLAILILVLFLEKMKTISQIYPSFFLKFQ